MHALSHRWSTFVAIPIAIFLCCGCRGSRPFRGLVQVTKQDSPLDEPEITPPRQRLAGPRTDDRGSNDRGTDDRGSDDRLAAGTTQRTRGGVTEVSMTSEESDFEDSRSPRPRAGSISSKTSRKTRPRQGRTPNRGQTDGGQTESTNQTVAYRSESDTVVSVRPRTSERDGEPAVSSSEDEQAILDAFAKYPPEVREDLRRLLSATAKKAKRTDQPDALASAIERNVDDLPELPERTGKKAAVRATRLAASTGRADGKESMAKDTKASRESSMVAVADQPKSSDQQDARGPSAPPEVAKVNVAVPPENAMATKQPIAEKRSSPVTPPPTPPVGNVNQMAKNDPSIDYEQHQTPGLESAVVQTLTDHGPSQNAAVRTASATERPGIGNSMISQAAPTMPEKTSLSAKAPMDPESGMGAGDWNDQMLFEALLKKLSNAPEGESEAARSSRLIKLRHLMVLAGDLDSAVKGIDGLSETEQEFIRHQLLGLWTMVDPNGHPIAARRITTALPQLREATKFAAASTDSLEVRSLAFCTEIEAYGQIKPFPNNRFQSGQQVILYCEVENFMAKPTEGGFETELQGSFDVYDSSDRKVVSQLLPADRQVSANYLRDYFIAYQMHLPKQLSKGKYRLQLTMEDVGGKKYGQSNISFEIKR